MFDDTEKYFQFFLILINPLPPRVSFFYLSKISLFGGYKKGTRRAHGLTQNQTSRSNSTQKLIWVLNDKIIDLLRVSSLLVP